MSIARSFFTQEHTGEAEEEEEEELHNRILYSRRCSKVLKFVQRKKSSDWNFQLVPASFFQFDKVLYSNKCYA